MKLRVVSFLSLVFLASPQTTHAKPGDKPASSTAPKSLAQTLTGEAKVDYDTARLLAGDGDYAGDFSRHSTCRMTLASSGISLPVRRTFATIQRSSTS